MWSQGISPVPTYKQAGCLLRALRGLETACRGRGWGGTVNIHSANFPIMQEYRTEPDMVYNHQYPKVIQQTLVRPLL